MVLLRKIGGRFEAIRRVMRSVVRNAVRHLSVVGTVYALLLLLFLSPVLFTIAATARADKALRDVPLSLASVIWIDPSRFSTATSTSAWKIGAIDHTKVGTVDHADFVVWFSGTYPDLADVAHGGLLNSVNNFAIYTDSGLTTLAKFQRISHDLTTGRVRYWIKIPSVSHTADTNFYPAIDTGNVTDLSDAANVWTSSFKPVIHTGDGSTLNLNDSTAAAQNFTNNGSIAAATGTLYGAANIAGASQQYASSAVAAVTAYPATFSAWVKMSNATLASGEERIILTVAKSSGLEELWLSYYNDGLVFTGLRAVSQGGGGVGTVNGGGAVDTNWHLCAVVFTSASAFTVYQDGVAIGSVHTGSNVTPAGLDHTYIGGLIYNGANFYGQMKGLVEEPRIAYVDRSPSWMLAEFNSQSDPASFYSLT